MCIACGLPIGKAVTETEFKNMWDNNSHGGGFAYINHDDEFVLQHSLEYDEFRKMWTTANDKYKATSPFLLHFRLASAGEVSVDNCHPFMPNDNVAFIHNGHMHNVDREKDDPRSDTKVFSEDYLARLPYNFLKNSTIRHLLSSFIGSSNKLIFLDKRSGRFTIFNKSAFVTDDDRVFSNGSFRYSKDAHKSTPASQGTYMGQKGVTYIDSKRCDYCGVTKLKKDYNSMFDLCDACTSFLQKLNRMSGRSNWDSSGYRALMLSLIAKHNANLLKKNTPLTTPRSDINVPLLGQRASDADKYTKDASFLERAYGLYGG